MVRIKVDGPYGQISGFPFAKDLAQLYVDVDGGNFGKQTVLNQLKQIESQSRTHQSNPDTLKHIKLIQQMASGVTADTEQTISKDYIDGLLSSTQTLTYFADQAEKSLELLTNNAPEDSKLPSFLLTANKNYGSEKKKIQNALVVELLYSDDEVQEQKGYKAAQLRASTIDGKITSQLQILQEKASKFDEQQKKKSYEVEVPGTPKKKITQYGVEIVSGRRSVKIVFTEDDLPKTDADFLNYLRQEKNFPERKDREAIKAFMTTVTGGGTVHYNGKRASGDITSCFSKAGSKVTVENGQTVEKIAQKAKVTASSGGGLAGYVMQNYKA